MSSRNPSIRTALSVLAAALCTAGVNASDILQTNSASLTSYPTWDSGSTSRVQGARPLPEQRLANLDGTARALRTSAPWSFAANPFESAQPGDTLGSVRLSTGAFTVSQVDLSLPAMVPWVIGRSYNAVQKDGTPALFDEQGPQGVNWFQTSQMEIRLSFHSEEDTAGDLVYLIARNDGYAEFARTANGDSTFRGVNGAAGVVKHETNGSGQPDTYVYYGPSGKIYFFGGNTASHTADWQIWKIVNHNGDTAYVGDPTTPATAVSSGFNSDGTISVAHDSAGTRYSYTYGTPSGDSYSRLYQVKAEIDVSSVWTTVGQVDYAYYDKVDNYWGDIGNLKLATVTTPLSNYASDTSEVWTRRQYYRYIRSSEDATHNGLVLAVGYDGIRRYTTGDATIETFNDSSVATSALLSYADAYLTYDGNRRVASARFDGECGCSGGINGLFTIHEYLPNTGASTIWHHRTVIEPPSGGAWMVNYFDATGQAVSRVLASSDPSTGSPSTWITKVIRNGDGQMTEVHTPANVTGYFHNTGGASAQGEISTSSSAGMVYLYDRVSSGTPEVGFLKAVRVANGSASLSSNAQYLSRTTYTDHGFSLSTATVYRPLVSTVRLYNVGGTSESANYDSEYSYTPDWWENSTTTNYDYIALKSMTATNPTVTTGNNGSGSATSSVRYFRKDGTTAFSVTGRGVTTYTAFTNGQLTKRIEDCKTNSGSDFESGDDPNGAFGISEDGNGFDRLTQYFYDRQGRIGETILPSTRHTLNWYTRLGDDRMATFRIPYLHSWDGPATYAVTNQSGSVEDCMIVALGEGFASDPSGWIHLVGTDENEESMSTLPSDPIEALDTTHAGPIARLTESVYNNTGRKLQSRRVYFKIPTTLTTDYPTYRDTWDIAYDDMGRTLKVTDPTGTINRTAYDVLGRTTSRSIGTSESGPDNMTTVETDQYDSGSAGGNSLLTQRTLYVQDSSTDIRATSYTYDYRGRPLLVTNAAAPHSLTKYDHRSRPLATALYTLTTGITLGTTDPAGTASGDKLYRVALSETSYDERGQVWKSTRHEIVQSGVSVGASSNTLDTLTWYDPDGRAILTQGEQLVKSRVDRIGRVTQRFTLATLSSTTYTNIYDSSTLQVKVASDKVLEEVNTYFDDKTDEVLMRAVVSRDYNDTSSTGALDTTYAGGNAFATYTVNGRMQATVYHYDVYERPIQTEFYGTNASSANAATLTYSTTPASGSSASVLVTKTVYDDDGAVRETHDALDHITRFERDAAGRVTATIANYNTGSSSSDWMRTSDLFTRYAYEHGLLKYLWVDQQGDDTTGTPPTSFTGTNANDQVTEYVYGTVKVSTAGTAGTGTPAGSEIATSNLLHHVIYPEGSYTDRTVTYAYNAQGQQVWTKDQAGNVIKTVYDVLGRQTERDFPTIFSPFDTHLSKITTSYSTRGLTDIVAQYDGTTCTNSVQYTFDGWGNLTNFDQDPDSLIGGTSSGRAPFGVSYAYTKATGGRHTLRRTSVTLPGSKQLNYTYSSSGGCVDDAASRLSSIYRYDVIFGDDDDDEGGGITLVTVTMAQYHYLGAGMLVGTDLTEAQVRSNLYETAVTGTPYPDLDPFNRVKSSRWTGYKTSGTRHFYQTDLAYDYASNILTATDQVRKAGANHVDDVKYSLDALYRLTRAQEGNLSSGSISSATRDERWTDDNTTPNAGLTETGNWKYHIWDGNGDTTLTDSGDLKETNTFNQANELLTRNTDSSGSAEFTLSYDKCGNQTSDGARTYLYDPLGRLVKITDTSSGNVIAKYEYNGLGYMTKRTVDTDLSGTVDGSDTPEYICYDELWRRVASYMGTATTPARRMAYHAAGYGGHVGSSYIDSTLCMEIDRNNDGTLESLDYYCQNWRADVVAMLDNSGKIVDNVRYSAYGVPRNIAGDVNGDGIANDDDWNDTETWRSTSSYHLVADLDLDGDLDWDDETLVYNMESDNWWVPQVGRLSSLPVLNQKGYAGYEWEPAMEGAGKALYHVRHRVYDAGTGRWTRKDPLSQSTHLLRAAYQFLTHSAGARVPAATSMYVYCRNLSVNAVDPTGLLDIPPLDPIDIQPIGIDPFEGPPLTIDVDPILTFQPPTGPHQTAPPNDGIWHDKGHDDIQPGETQTFESPDYRDPFKLPRITDFFPPTIRFKRWVYDGERGIYKEIEDFINSDRTFTTPWGPVTIFPSDPIPCPTCPGPHDGESDQDRDYRREHVSPFDILRYHY